MIPIFNRTLFLLQMIQASWLFYFSKYIELLDTVGALFLREKTPNFLCVFGEYSLNPGVCFDVRYSLC